MTKFMLAAGVAAMALSAPVLAGPGGGHGGGNPHAAGGGNPPTEGGGGHGGGGGGQGGAHGGGLAVVGGGGSGQLGHGGGFDSRGSGGHQGHGHAGFALRGERTQGHGHFAKRGGGFLAHGGGHRTRTAMRGHDRANRHVERVAKVDRGTHFVRDHGRALAFAGAGTAAFAGARYAQYHGQRNVIDGCPPGLAAKDNGCMPPGQLKQRWGYGAPLRQSYADAYLPGLYRSWYPDNDQYYYRYGDGYAYRVDRSNNFVSGLFPLGGSGYYAPGENYPSAYDFYNVPQPYQSYYPDNGDYDYRYGDGAIYQVDRSSGLVNSIVALLTGGGLGGGLGGLGGGLGGLGIGQPLPAGYDAYNLPDAYRDRYYDTPNENYRYADGSIYQVDPKTQLIQRIISALV